MSERNLPGLGLLGFWNLGADGWKPGMDNNLRLLSAAVQLSVLSRVDIEPDSPTDGEVYILNTGVNANKIAIRDDGAWVYITPGQGWIAFIQDTQEHRKFVGTAWSILVSGSGGGGIPDAPNDGDYYARRNEAWEAFTPGGGGGSSAVFTENAQTGTTYTLVLADAPDVVVSLANAAAITVTIPTNATAAIPVGSSIDLWQKGAGQVTIVGDTGVTLSTPDTATASLREEGSWAVLLKTGTNTWSLIGDLEAAPGSTADAEDIGFDNTASGLTAANVQAAIDEIVASLGDAAFQDYEEGTFLPAFTFTNPGDLSVMYAGRDGFYRKIGDLIFASFRLGATVTFTTASGNGLVTGLPFAADSAQLPQNPGGSFGGPGVVPVAGPTNPLATLQLNIQPGVSQLFAVMRSPAYAPALITAADVTSGLGLDAQASFVYKSA